VNEAQKVLTVIGLLSLFIFGSSDAIDMAWGLAFMGTLGIGFGAYCAHATKDPDEAASLFRIAFGCFVVGLVFYIRSH
jgi:hypothetical protein